MASAQGFGETHAELLAQKMGGKGEYAVFVGSLTVPLRRATRALRNVAESPTLSFGEETTEEEKPAEPVEAKEPVSI